jgi:hypothetical protein
MVCELTLSVVYRGLRPSIMVSVLTLRVVDRGLSPSIMVCVLTLGVVDCGLESQYNGICAHLECDRLWVGVPV